MIDDVCQFAMMLFRFPESEDYGKKNEGEAYKVVPADWFALEDSGDDYCENRQRDTLGQDFELHQREGTTVDLAADAVGGDHKTVFEEGYAPRRQDDEYQRPRGVDFHFGQLQVAIPGKGHKDVADDEQEYGRKSFGHLS